MKNYKGKVAIYTEQELKYKWLMKIESQERKRCNGDLLKHLYLSGPLAKIDENCKLETVLLNDVNTKISNVRLKSLEFLGEKEAKKYSFY
ncbi:MAG TPA: hypothetical protein VJ912_01425 [Candidatus Nanoarchaeia archaeon]|nr:hypothetical protein [Candidatus Nanoarchaeia archaeon]